MIEVGHRPWFKSAPSVLCPLSSVLCSLFSVHSLPLHARQHHTHLMPLLVPFLADEAVLAVVPSFDCVGAGDAIVGTIAILAGDGDLLDSYLAYGAGERLALVGIEQRD